MTDANRAAIDVGSNSVRMLVVNADGEPVTREMTITRLAAGVDRTGRLDDAALERTLATIARYRELWESHGVASVRIAATSAVRDAADRDRFFDGVQRVAGVGARVLSGGEEAATSFAGAVRAVDVDGPRAVLDIGGGSTELIVGDASDAVRSSVSLQLGCVRLTERVLGSDPPTVHELGEARREVAAQLDHADEVLQRQGVAVTDAATLVGVAGTVTTAAALHLGLDAYLPDRIHGTALPHAAVREQLARLSALPAAERAGLGPMQAGREDVIIGGLLVLDAVLERYGFPSITASEADILDGLALGLGAATW